MRRASWITAVVACLALVAYAGEAGHKGMDKAAHVAKLKAELNLSPDQVKAVEKIFDNNKDLEARVAALHKELADLRAAKAAPTAISAKEAELAAATTELRSKRHAEIRKVLSAEQQAKFDKMLADMKAGHGSGHGEGHGSGHGSGHGEGHGSHEKK